MNKTINVSQRLVSFFLALAMLLTLLPAIPLITRSTANAASQTITVYFKDTDGWGNVYGYVWDATSTPLMGEWPGTKLSTDSTGLYKLSVGFVPSTTNSFNFIFNNSSSGKTGDLSLTYAQLTSGDTYWVGGSTGSPAKYAPPSISGDTVTFTYESSSASAVYVAGSMNGWSTSADPMTKSGSTFTCTMELAPGQYEYKLVADGNWINDPANPQTTGTDNNNYFIMPGMQDTTVTIAKGVAATLPAELSYTNAAGDTVLTAVTYSVPSDVADYVTLSGNTVTVSTAYTGSTLDLTATNTAGASCTVTLDLSGTTDAGAAVKLHFLNTLGWSTVTAHTWVTASSGDTGLTIWPGDVIQRGTDGWYTLEVSRSFASGEGLGMLFTSGDGNGSKTVDLTVSASQIASGVREFWIAPSGSTDSEGKYDATIATSESGIFRPHLFGDGSVTFQYDGSASTVYLAGSFNDWSTSATKLTKNASGVWTTTVALDPGVYEYKYIVDGEWITDPHNGLTGGYDGNSILVVPTGDAPVDTGKITVKLHFYRESGDYAGWDVWYWDSETSGSAATLETVSGDKGRVATFTIDGGSNVNAGYVVRKTDWSDKEFYDRFIDLSDVYSGTVHYFLNSGSASGSRILDADVVNGPKITYANLDYDTGKIWTDLSTPYSGAASTAFSISGPDSTVTVTGVERVNSDGYWLTLSRKLGSNEALNYQIGFNSTAHSVGLDGLFYSDAFATDYTYEGSDLGATWSASSTTFKVWAPTAQQVHVKLYQSGNYGTDDQLQYVDMTLGDQGIWSVTVTGDLQGIYYNYDVTFPTYTVEATDPYAKGAGANGDRGMIVNWDATDPTGWANDVSPNQGMSYTDAIIYELHVREFTIDSSSGVQNKGKYLGLTENGTSYNGYATGLAHLKELGITHVQLMPVYDFNSVDEYKLDEWEQYAWGYDPKNYSVPEGGYATDPFNGNVRITEFKQMVQVLHANGINVVMDVVFNHTFDGGNYCGNKIVPNYYSRFFGEGNWSNGSGCGNDLATERGMVRNMIVDSIMHWVEEYHIDGFRFDLVGLIDTQTINEIVDTVHAKYPYVMFYGEGWAPGSTAVEEGYSLATQGNAWEVSGFGFFNDTIRNAIAGDNGNSWGFATGSGDYADTIANAFRASNGWSTSPTQTINYVSCHDNYCLTDKIIISRNGAYWDEMVRMNGLSAAIVLLSQGVPFIYSGDELLREKKDGDGNRYDNAYGTNDYINKIRWSDLQDKEYAQRSDDYYAGLIAFRKNHAALRCPSGSDAWNYTSYYKIDNNCILFYVDGYPNYECSDGICIIFNGSGDTKWVDLYGKIPSGNWQACIHGTQAGTDALWGIDVTDSAGNVGVEPYSATVLVLGDLIDEDSVYQNNLGLVDCDHESHNQNGTCTTCGNSVGHRYNAIVTRPTCTTDGYTSFTCTICGKSYTGNTVAATGHSWSDGTCGTCGAVCSHSYVDGVCTICGMSEPVTVVTPTLTLRYPTLSLEGEVFMNIYYEASDLDDVVEMGLVTFSEALSDGTIDNAVDVIGGYVTDGTLYMVRTNGIPARNLGDDIYFKVYAKLSDGSYVYTRVVSYSAAAFAKSTLASTSSTTQLKAMTVAMMDYGAAAQMQFGYKTDALMNSFLTDEQKALVSAYDASMIDDLVAVDSSKVGQFTYNSAGYSKRYPSLSLEGAFSINYYFTTKLPMDHDLTLYYWDLETYNAVDELTAQNATGSMTMEASDTANEFWGCVDDIAAKRVNETVFVAGVYTSGGVTYSTGVLGYSIGYYCRSIIVGDGSTMDALAQAIAVYGYYAEQHFANQ